MTAAARNLWLAAALATLCGCPSPATTRLPSLAPAPNPLERRNMGHYDPFPDPDLGPETNTRPPEFLEPREPQRQALEGRFLQGAPAGPAPPGYSTGAYRDNDVVR